MMKTVVTAGMLFALVSSAAADYAGFPQRVYRGRTYLIIKPRPSMSVWYAGDGVVRSEEERVTQITRKTTTKQYYLEK